MQNCNARNNTYLGIPRTLEVFTYELSRKERGGII